MNTTESTYVKILRWAYEKQVDGFTEEELLIHFKLNDIDGRKWYTKVFKDRTALIDAINYSDKWTLTSEGMSAAVDYLELKAAQESSVEAKHLALVAIGIGIIVGIGQILIGLWQIYLFYYPLQ